MSISATAPTFRSLSCPTAPWLALCAATLAQTPPGADDVPPALRQAISQRQTIGRDPLAGRVVFDAPGDGRLWAATTSYKASFGREGMVYIPFLGSQAPQLYPVHFVVRAVHVGGRALEFASEVAPSHDGTRVTFDRGCLREIYDLGAEQVEQSFAIDCAQPGDAVITLEAITELAEDAERAGVQFANQLGAVSYGEAFVVTPQGKLPVVTHSRGRRLEIHVPQSARGTGTLLVDPIIRTERSSAQANVGSPDVCSLGEQFMVVWSRDFGGGDFDVFTEMFRGDGTLVVGSQAALDLTAIPHSLPRVAARGRTRQALVAMERNDGVGTTVVGRIRSFNPPFTVDAPFRISRVDLIGESFTPMVGGDPSNEAGSVWLVAWKQRRGTFQDYVAATVFDTGAVAPESVLHTTDHHLFSHVRVSRSNGRGQSSAPAHWLVAFEHISLPLNSDVWATLLDHNGAVAWPATVLHTSPLRESLQSVSCSAPAAGNGGNRFMLTWSSQIGTSHLEAVVVDDRLQAVVPTTDLTPWLPALAHTVEVDSDGFRFALASASLFDVSITTVAVDGTTFVTVDPMQTLATLASHPVVVAKRSGGGRATDYAVLFRDGSAAQPLNLALYRGHTPVGSVTRRRMACGGLGFDTDGRTYLGDVAAFAATDVGTDFVGLWFGLPGPTASICASCSTGLRLDLPILNFPGSRAINLPIPPRLDLVGLVLAGQAYAVGSGPCDSGLRLSDTIDFTLR